MCPVYDGLDLVYRSTPGINMGNMSGGTNMLRVLNRRVCIQTGFKKFIPDQVQIQDRYMASGIE